VFGVLDQYEICYNETINTHTHIVHPSNILFMAAQTTQYIADTFPVGVVVVVGMLLLVIMLTGLCLFRHKDKHNNNKNNNNNRVLHATSSNINMTFHTSHDSGLDDVDSKDPWYEISQLSFASGQSPLGTYSANTRHHRQPSDDSYYIPTIKGYFREKRGKNHVCDIDFRERPTDLTNPYQQESAAS